MTTEKYTALWQKWIAEIKKTLPETNRAFNLKQGISDSDLKMYQSQIDIDLPEDLINFYRANNVENNGGFSAFVFDLNGYWYNVLPFNKIPEEWNFESFDEETVSENYESAGISDKIIVADFANPNWIPFANSDQGDLLLFDTEPSEKGVYGQIIELQNDSWERNVVANSLAELIENQITKLQNGEREVLEVWLDKKSENNNKTMTENEQLIYDSIYSQIRMGFSSIDEIKENIIEEIEDNDFSDEISNEWAFEHIEKEWGILEKESTKWQKPTNTDKLIQAFDKLCDNNIIALHKAGYTTSDGEYEVVEVEKNLRENNIQSDGYCFYHEQDLSRAIDNSSTTLTLAFQKIDNSDDKITIEIGKKIVTVLQKFGFQTEWEETANSKITIIDFKWQLIYNENNRDILDYDAVIKRMCNKSNTSSFKKYFEFKDEKSSKFWEINLTGSSLTTCYGKIGTTGQLSEKNFENEIKAEKEYQKLIAEKTKKGYLEIIKTELINATQIKKANSFNANLMSFYDIKHRFPEDAIAIKYANNDDSDEENKHDIVYINGDLDIMNLDLDNLEAAFKIKNLINRTTIVVDGNLNAENIFNEETDGSTSLLVFGNINAKNIIVGGQEIYVCGDLNVKEVFWGDYNHGDLVVKGKINVNILIDTDYSLPQHLYTESLGGTKDKINFRFSDELENELTTDDYQRVAAIFSDEILEKEDELDEDEIYGWGSLLSRYNFLENLQNGKSLLKSDFDISKLKLNAYKELAEICTENKVDKLAINNIIDAFEKENANQNDETTFFQISEKINDAGLNLIMVFDWKAEIKDVSFVIKQYLEHNFNHSMQLPVEEDYKEIYPSKEYDIADLFIDFDIPLRKNDFQLTFIQTDSDNHSVVLHKSIDYKKIKNSIKKIGLNFYEAKGLEHFDIDYLNVPTIFEGKHIINSLDLEFLSKTFDKVFEYFEPLDQNESRIFLHKSKAQVFVNKAHKRESDGAKVDKSIYFLTDDGAEIFFWYAPKSFLQKLTNKQNDFQILYKNINNNIFQYKPIFDVEGGIEITDPLWTAFLETLERGIYLKKQFEDIVEIKEIQTILNYKMVQEKYPNSWIDPDQTPWFGNNCYSFKQIDNQGLEGFKIVREIPNTDTDFEAESYYFWHYKTANQVYLAYLANYHENNHEIYGMYYSSDSKRVPFYDYKLYQEALKYWKEALITLPKENEKYLTWVKEEQYFIDLKKSLKSKQKEERRQNYKVTKPFETIEIDGILFALKDRNEAQDLLKVCIDFDGNEVYDAFEMLSYDDPDEDYKSFFLVAENEVTAEKIDLQTYPPDNDSVYILGYIFLKELTLQKYVECYDIDFSPPIICLENANIASLILSGTKHYFHKDITCINLYGKYNHGSLIVKGMVNTKFIIADDFSMKLQELTLSASWSYDRNIEIMNDLSNLDLEVKSELNYLFGTHSLEYCLQDRFIYKDEYGYKIKEDGIKTEENRYAEDEETFFDCLRNGENPLDYNKIEFARNYFLENAFEFTKNLFLTNNTLKNFPVEETYYHHHNKLYDHISFHFANDKDYYTIGYWNTWYNISVNIMLHKSGENDKHSLNVFYWDKENTTVRYQYTNNFDEYNYYTLICQKVFWQAVEEIEKEKTTETESIIADNQQTELYKIIFPNSFTQGNATSESIESLHNQYHFSSNYAAFLKIQNGFDAYDFEDNDNTNRNYVQKSNLTVDEYYQDLRSLFGANEITAENEDNIFKDYLLMIGEDKGGNAVVEVLHGKFKGYIGTIDHEMYAGSDNLEEFIETFDLTDFEKSSIDEKTDMLCDEDIMMAFYAKNIQDFIANCLFFIDGEVRVIETNITKEQTELANEKTRNYPFLKGMYEDQYFPNNCVDMAKEILVDLCFQIEKTLPKTLEELYKLTHIATEKFNDLQEDFEDNDSEIETAARDCIGEDFAYIANAYGFNEADTEELIATREW